MLNRDLLRGCRFVVDVSGAAYHGALWTGESRFRNQACQHYTLDGFPQRRPDDHEPLRTVGLHRHDPEDHPQLAYGKQAGRLAYTESTPAACRRLLSAQGAWLTGGSSLVHAEPTDVRGLVIALPL